MSYMNQTDGSQDPSLDAAPAASVHASEGSAESALEPPSGAAGEQISASDLLKLVQAVDAAVEFFNAYEDDPRSVGTYDAWLDLGTKLEELGFQSG